MNNSSSECDKILFNCRTKVYPDGSTNTTFCNRYIFKDKQAEQQYFENHKSEFEEETKENIENENKTEKTENENKIDIDIENKKETRERFDSVKRSRDKVFDIARCNQWKYFITITFNGSLYESKEPKVVIKMLTKWLNNQSSRKGLKYLLIPEYHKKGGIHCHALVNDCLQVCDSGTRLVNGYNKSVTLATIEKRNLTVRNVVYNIPAWKYGFSTAIEVDNSSAFAFYITKYITKGNKKIFGQYYWSSRSLVREPEIILHNKEFNFVNAPTYEHNNCGTKYKYRSNTEFIPNFDELSSKFDDIGSFLDYIYSDEYKLLAENYKERSNKNDTQN